MNLRTTLAMAILPFVGAPCAAAHAEGQAVKVFVLAGQSNMEGQAVVDLGGPDYNTGKGTLAALLKDPVQGARWGHLRDAGGEWAERGDVWVRYTPEGAAPCTGPLAFGFTPYRDGHHFGPELEFGHVIGDALDQDVLLVKTAWGGKSLYVDFRPPSSGGTTGPYYARMIEDVRAALANFRKDFPGSKADRCELAGFVWYQGWNDGCDPKHAVPEYERNLVNLIHDVRRDLGAPALPVVVGELTGPWVKAPGEWDTLRKAQSAAAARPEFAGNVAFVPTHDFVRRPEDSPNPGHGHHEFGNAETYLLVGDALAHGMLDLLHVPARPAPATAPARALRVGKGAALKPPVTPGQVQPGEMAGYLLVGTERVPPEFNAGFSLYAAAWPLLAHNPGHRFQTGLFGTWMHAQYPGKPPKDLYSDIEGGLGWWRDTRFPTETPKFIMGGVAVNFSEIANGPAHGAGSWDEPKGLYGVAQLSPWILFPIDGLNLRQGTCGELFGYGYLPLPLVQAKARTAGTDVPTGDNCWTLFLNTRTFKGPVCFFTPYFWSHSAVVDPNRAGQLLDTRPSEPNKPFQMETQWVPAALGADATGQAFARVAPTSFPVGAEGRTVVLHRLTSYSRAALWDAVKAWFDGGAAASGAIDPAGSHVQRFKPEGGSTWRIHAERTPKDAKVAMAWSAFAKPVAPDPTTYGYEWDPRVVTAAGTGAGARVTLPEYFRLRPDGAKLQWVAAKESDVPAETGLRALRFDRPREDAPEPYATPDAPTSAWKRPGPAAGPFTARLGDGSVVTYCWYRFADQPALQHADIPPEERERMQALVEKLHRAWTKDRDYLAPPTVGTLAELDPAQLVTPPKGLEVGYVPIAIRQEAAKDAAPAAK